MRNLESREVSISIRAVCLRLAASGLLRDVDLLSSIGLDRMPAIEILMIRYGLVDANWCDLPQPLQKPSKDVKSGHRYRLHVGVQHSAHVAAELDVSPCHIKTCAPPVGLERRSSSENRENRAGSSLSLP